MRDLFLNFKREVLIELISSSVDLSHAHYNSTSLVEFFMTVQEARAFWQPKEDTDPAEDCNDQSNPVIYVYITRDEPELEGDIGHSETKNQKDEQTSLVLYRLRHQLDTIDVRDVVAACF